MHLVKSQGADFGIDLLEGDSNTIDLLEGDNNEIEENNGENMEFGDILWFNNVQMKNDDEAMTAPTIVEHSEELKNLGSTSEQNKKWNGSVNFQSTGMMGNDCVCSKTNKYKCQCFGDRNL